MKILKRLAVLWMVMFMAIGMFGCDSDNAETRAEYSAISYTKPIAVGDIDAYAREVSIDNKKNNAPLENGIVLCPYYTLEINGKEVPVYTTRCTNGTHSFAWIDVKGAPDEFALDVKLITEKKYSGVAVLPEKSGVKAELTDKTVTATITAYGDYSFAFSTDRLKTYKVTNQPLTLIVAPEQIPEIPDGYDYVEIEPGKYGYGDLVFNQPNTVYCFKSGEYEIRRIIASKLQNILFYFEPGTYISVYETPEIGLDEYNIGGPAFGIQNCENVRIEGRALFDFSGVRGLYKDPETGKDVDMTQYVFNFYNNKNMYVSGITTINSNHWTFRIGACEDILAEWNVMLGYRNYSDGFIYSDCVRATARYMFARTGDDGMEVKALGSYGGYKDTIPVAKEVLFEKCTVWNDAAAAFGVIYENYKPIDGVIFRDCSVGFSTCSWSPNNSALNIRLAYPGTAHWKNITFDGIEIFECYKNAFTLEWNLQGGSVENVLVKDVTVRNAGAAIRVNVDTNPVLPYDSLTQLCKNFVFENFTFAGTKLTEADKESALYFSYGQPTYKDLFTMK
jgi:hypothetical protein